jgi:capsular polysaccharide biosynthesis protein
MIHYLRVLKRLGWLLIVLPVLGALVGLGVSRLQAPIYEARATVLIRPAAPLNAIDGDARNLNTAEILQTNALLMTQPALLRQVINELSLRRSGDDLAQQVDVKAQPNTTALIVTVRDGDAQTSRDVANRLVTDYLDQGEHVRQQQLDQYVSRMQARLAATEKAVSDEQLRLSALQAVTTPTADQLAQRATLQQQIQADQAHYSDLVQNLAAVEAQTARGTDSPIFVSPAALPATPVSPNHRLNVAIGAFGGVLLALLTIVLLAPATPWRASGEQQPDEGLGGKGESEWMPWAARHRPGERTAGLPTRRRSGRGQASPLHGDAPQK